MEIKINQKNAAGQRHGYCVDGSFKRHFYNNKLVGLEIFFHKWHCHHSNNHLIGCEKQFNSQCFYNKPGKKFGEEVIWK